MSPARDIDEANALLPEWARELILLYQSHACSQFILSGNVYDRIVLPAPGGASIRQLDDFIREALLGRFDVVLSYDIGNGIRIEKGRELFSQWPWMRERAELPKAPREAVETLTRYFRYCANLGRLERSRGPQIGCLIHAANLVVPAVQGGFSYDLNALALLIRDWSCDEQLADLDLATFLISENLNDLHSLVVQNPRSANLTIPLPDERELECALGCFIDLYPVALADLGLDLPAAARQLTGAGLAAIASLLRTQEYQKKPLAKGHLSELKKSLVERDCNGLVEFVESDRSMSQYAGQEAICQRLMDDLELWRQGELEAMPMGYLLCGPVGTGKTFLVDCLAGEAGIPVVKFKNFRDKWVGSTESNLERIFRLLHALGRCFVFVDEADQALGRRDGGDGDSGLSGRVYSMIADEMSDTRNRGRIVWILASSRPDLIEVDLKRPGRIDVKLPIFPTANAAEGFELIRTLCVKRGLDIAGSDLARLDAPIPSLLTPGAADSLAVKVYRATLLGDCTAFEALERCLAEYQSPVSTEVLQAQIRLAVAEASDWSLVPDCFRS